MKKEIVKCPFCGRTVSRNSWSKEYGECDGLYKRDYWCKSCQKEFEFTFSVNPTSQSWTTDGYILVKIAGRGWVREHTFVWEQKNGELPKGYVIHHINGDKADNQIEYLIAIPKKSHSPYLSSKVTICQKD